MSYCIECGQYGEADGGIGCQCNKCRCGLTAGEGGYCFLCRPCPIHKTSMQMHTSSQLQECSPSKPKTPKTV